jgi:hypothetical protein
VPAGAGRLLDNTSAGRILRNNGGRRQVTKNAATRRLDLPALRGFFMGVIGWPPQVVLHGAVLRDLCEAYIAHSSPAAAQDLPPRNFLHRMLAQYPDTAKK